MASFSVYVDTRDFKKLHDQLEKVRKRALPYAARDALNGCAFELRKEWQEKVRTTFTLRNKFTERSIRVEKAKSLDLKAMQSRTGSVAAYMADQEQGATVRGKGKHKAIPGPAAANLKPGSHRTRVVSAGKRLGAIHINSPQLAKYGRRRQNAVVLAIAIRKGERFALLNRATQKGRGVFEVKGLKRKARVKLLYNVSKSSVRVKPEPTMQRAVNAAGHRFERVIYESLLRQLRRAKAFGF